MSRYVSRYVSPFDEAARPARQLAPRSGGPLAGRRVVLLDIRKNRGSELLDRLEARFAAEGATVYRTAKEIFSKPAAPEVIEEVAIHGDLAVEALAD